MKIPRHVAIIPDGNRRWAKKHRLAISKGHEQGFEVMRSLIKECKDFGPKILSFYIFSTENFQRPKKEVDYLFTLLKNALDDFTKELIKNKVQLRVSGSSDNIQQDLYEKIIGATERCKTGEFILNLCFNYGAQEDIVQTIKKCLFLQQTGKLSADEIDVPFVQSQLWNGDLPEVDLLIRTSGEYRLSNFMLWQCAYAEFFFEEKLWPDYSAEDLKKAFEAYQNRKRNFGK